MNAPRSLALLAAGLALALTSSVHAGPGLAYWQSLTSTQPLASPQTGAARHLTCANATSTPIVAMRPSWHNARGPLHAVQIGVRQTCTTCGTSIAMRPSWHNQRGPLAPVTTQASHVCDGSCGGPTRRA